MELKNDTIEQIIREALAQMGDRVPASGPSYGASAMAAEGGRDPFLVSVGVSNRHVHLSRSDMDTLFGPGSSLTRKKAMRQPGHYAAEETVTLRGPKREISRVRVLGPLRGQTQVEVSVADCFTLGIDPVLRMSGYHEGTPGVEIVGPQGSVQTESGLIVAMRHIHMPPETARGLGLENGEEVDVLVDGERAGVMSRVVIRAAEATVPEMHIDIEEANAFCLKNDDLVRIRKRS